MIPGTTPRVTLKFNKTSDFNDISEVNIVFKSKLTEKNYKKIFTLSDIVLDSENKTMSVLFDQEETLKMIGLTSLEVQVRIKYGTTDEKIFGTNIETIPVSRVLDGGII